MKLVGVVAALALSAQAVLVADVLVLRDGRRVSGTVVSVRGSTVEFEDEDGRVRRYSRADVRSIQFEEEDAWDDRRSPAGRAALRQRTVTVDARAGWTDTGVDVRAGQEVAFEATGQVRWGPGRRDGAAGERGSPYNAGRPIPDRNAAALIGRIGASGDPFFIGDAREALRLRGSGRLYLGINDDYLEDNSGSLRVVILY
ncbi:MAG TPA: hypothetical protein VM364_03815 [Vicinamibacterales bacterium]|nr:hypothetical protein [Vicinamibacterales bacterium]